jgi:hypothetical protein
MSTEQLLALYGQPQASQGVDPQALLRVPSVQQQLTPEQLAAAGRKRQRGEELSWSDVPGEMISNLGSSAYQYGADIVQPFLHPIDTAESLYKVGKGALQKAGVVEGSDATPYADAVGEHFAGRYGSMEGFKKALAKDPVGVAGDLSTVLTGGAGAAARVPGLAGSVTRNVGRVGRAIDPIFGPLTGAGHAAAALAGRASGVGGTPYRMAVEAGREGGEAAEAFRTNLRGQAPAEEAVAEARHAVGQMRIDRGDVYRQEMQRLGMDTTVLNFRGIDNAIRQMDASSTFKGITKQPETQPIRNRIRREIAMWKNLDPREYHTPEGLDALKQRIGDIRDATEYGSPARRVADAAYQSVRQTIVNQVPQYDRIMRGYERASTMIREMERTLSLNPNASIDTSLRKLQSVLRNNVTSAYGRRAELADYLRAHGAPHLMRRLAGQALNSWAPRGLMNLAAGSAVPAVGAFLGGGGSLMSAVGAIPGLAAMSPRLGGEVSYLTGLAQRYTSPLRPVPEIARQAGRIPRVYINTSEFDQKK